MGYEELIELGKKMHPGASYKRHETFASSVHYFVTGESLGNGPSVREHICSWSLAGDGEIGTVNTTLGKLTQIHPDGRLPGPGEWKIEKAAEFCEPIVYGPLPKLWRRVIEQEYIFNNDEEDIKEMIGVLTSELLVCKSRAHKVSLGRVIKKVSVSG